MEMTRQQFVVETRVLKDSPLIRTTVTIEAGSVPDSTVIASAISGNSPRVNHQANWRRNGIPEAVTMTPSEWFGKPKQVTVPETPESIKARAKADPDFRKRMADMMEQLRKMDEEEQNEE